MKTKKQLKKTQNKNGGGFLQTLKNKITRTRKKPNSNLAKFLTRDTSPKNKNELNQRTAQIKQSNQARAEQFNNEVEKKGHTGLGGIKKTYKEFIEKLPELRNNIKLLHDKLKVDNLSSFNKNIIYDLNILLEKIKPYYFHPKSDIKYTQIDSISENIKNLHQLMKHKESTTNTHNTVNKKSFNTSFNTNNASTRTLEYDVMVLIKNLEFMLFGYRLYLHGKAEKKKLISLQDDIINSLNK